MRRILSGMMLIIFAAACSAAHADTRMIFPRVLFQKNRFLGIAIANPTGTEAQLTFKAYRLDGTLYAGDGIKNGVVERVAAGAQYAQLASQIFNPPAGEILGATPTRLWVEVTSPVDGLTGFFLEGDDGFQFMDGSELAGAGTDLLLPIVENTGASITELNIVNPQPEAAQLILDFIRSDGSVVSTQNATVPKLGGLQGPLSALFNISYAGMAGLRLRSDRSIVFYGSIYRQSDSSLITIPAMDMGSPTRTLYFPQLAEGDEWTTAVGIANLDLNQRIMATITAYQSDGTLFAVPGMQNPATEEIPPGGIFRAPLRTLFGFPGSPLRTGWLKVEAAGSQINGFVEYGAGSNRALVTAQLFPVKQAMFSHQVMVSPYFTGLAVLNPGSLAANIDVFSLAGDGQTIGRTQRVLRPGQKEALLVQQWVQAAAGKQGGSVFLRSDQPVIATQLFGTDNFFALANVPPQQITTGFAPASPGFRITMTPPLAVVETGKTQQFQAVGQANLQWSVEGIRDGNAAVGTISASGLYRAPSKAPGRRALSVQASNPSGESSGGASLDVVQRETIAGGLTLVTSVAYLENLQRFFIAEQQLLSSAASGRQQAAAGNARILELSSAGSTSVFIPSIPGEVISKMVPFTDSGSSYLLMAGQETGKIYRLNVSSKQLATVATGLNRPTSIAYDASTGVLLVVESGANLITPISKSQILAASEPEPPQAALPGRGKVPAMPVASPEGVAVDRCSGAVYVSTTGGLILEYLGNRSRTVASGLDHPRQLLVLYRDGYDCSDGITLAVAEATRISLLSLRTLSPVPLWTGLEATSDLAFLTSGNPFTPGGEAAIGFAEAPQGVGASRVSEVPVGGLYQGNPPQPPPRRDTEGNTGFPYEDPVGDTFSSPATAGKAVPDIRSVNGFAQAGSFLITIRLTQPFALAPLDSHQGLNGSIFLRTQAGGGQIPPEVAALIPFGTAANLTFDTIISLSDGMVYSHGEGQYYGGATADVRVFGDTVTVSIPTGVADLRNAVLLLMVGYGLETTDIAPNSGQIRLGP